MYLVGERFNVRERNAKAVDVIYAFHFIINIITKQLPFQYASGSEMEEAAPRLWTDSPETEQREKLYMGDFDDNFITSPLPPSLLIPAGSFPPQPALYSKSSTVAAFNRNLFPSRDLVHCSQYLSASRPWKFLKLIKTYMVMTKTITI